MNKIYFLAISALLICASAALADYPSRTIKMIVPFSAGGGTDVPARLFASELEKLIERNVVVKNVVGASGTVGTRQLSRARADGHTLGFLPVGTVTTQPHLKNTRYDLDSLVPICMVSEGPFYLVVPEDSPLHSVEDFIAAAKQRTIRFVGAGLGSMSHLAQLTLDRELGVDLKFLPSGGGGDMASEINGGRADATVWFSDYDMRFGWRGLAIMADERSEDHPDLPTMSELGYDVSLSVWFGLFAQRGTAFETVNRLASLCRQVVKSDSFQENMARANRMIHFMGTEEFTQYVRDDFDANRNLLEGAGLIR